MKLDPDLAVEAKALVALAFRNGPIEDLHAGTPCTVRSGNAEISRISDEEMKAIMSRRSILFIAFCGSGTATPWPTTRI